MNLQNFPPHLVTLDFSEDFSFYIYDDTNFAH